MKIVVAVDGSKYSRWALQWVQRLPFAARPSLVAVHALDVGTVRAPFMVQPVVAGNEPYIHEEVERLKADARHVIDETKRLLADAPVGGRVLLEKGPAATRVLAHARRGDLLVLGSRGLNPLDRFLLGSVSTQVVHHAPCSVLVVKQPPRKVHRFLFATDGSKSSDRALRFLTSALRPDGLELTVAHIMPFLRYPELKAAGQALVQRDAARLVKAGYAVKETMKLGQPADELIKSADRQEVDAIVVGAKGMGAIARFFLGSVSSKLVHHSTCSVLVIR